MCEVLVAGARTGSPHDESAVIGVCHCHAGFGGADCSMVLASPCPLGCSAHGVCRDGGCECRDGMAPPACAFAAGSRLARIATAVAALTPTILAGQAGKPVL